MNQAFVLEVPRSLDIKLTIETPLHCTGSAFWHRPHRLTTIDVATSCNADILRTKTVESVTFVGTSEK